MQRIRMLRWPGTEHISPRQRSGVLTFLSANAGFDMFDDQQDNDRRPNGIVDASDYIVDIREFDVPYHVRVAIDKGRAR